MFLRDMIATTFRARVGNLRRWRGAQRQQQRSRAPAAAVCAAHENFRIAHNTSGLKLVVWLREAKVHKRRSLALALVRAPTASANVGGDNCNHFGRSRSNDSARPIRRRILTFKTLRVVVAATLSVAVLGVAVLARRGHVARTLRHDVHARSLALVVAAVVIAATVTRTLR